MKKAYVKALMVGLAVALALGWFGGSVTRADSSRAGLVELTTVNSRIRIEMRYATTENFLGKKVYLDGRCFVLPALAEKLDRAQKLLEKDGLGLKVYDGFRPLAVQRIMWEIMPNANYVADPNKRGSVHNRGGAVDLTLVDAQGRELEMPTPFDTFSTRAHQSSLEPTPQQRANRMLLRHVMMEVGLALITTEWWHYQLPDAWQYPIIE